MRHTERETETSRREREARARDSAERHLASREPATVKQSAAGTNQVRVATALLAATAGGLSELWYASSTSPVS